MTTTTDYATALAEARRVGASPADNAGLIALLCATTVQRMVGAVAPPLVYAGAMNKGLTATEFARLMAEDPRAVEDLMWA